VLSKTGTKNLNAAQKWTLPPLKTLDRVQRANEKNIPCLIFERLVSNDELF
jgi:hypothetical protein